MMVGSGVAAGAVRAACWGLIRKFWGWTKTGAVGVGGASCPDSVVEANVSPHANAAATALCWRNVFMILPFSWWKSQLVNFLGVYPRKTRARSTKQDTCCTAFGRLPAQDLGVYPRKTRVRSTKQDTCCVTTSTSLGVYPRK